MQDVGATEEKRPEGEAEGEARRCVADLDADLGDAADVRASTANSPTDTQSVALTLLTICGETQKRRRVNIGITSVCVC